jgi:hypothetical protein
MAAVTVRIAIDLNTRGWDVARLPAGCTVSFGDSVLAVEPFDGIVADATVVDVDRESKLVWLAVDRTSFRDDPEAAEDPACE